jgi:branched-chain amino acid transport system ATP-binding protein
MLGSPDGGRWTIDGIYELFPRLAERKRISAAELSGGEQQMLAIGRALLRNPRLLVMDEPSEGLAPPIIALVGERIGELRRAGQSVLIAEQNVDLALAVADRVAVLGDGGRISWSGPPDALRADAALVSQLVGL